MTEEVKDFGWLVGRLVSESSEVREDAAAHVNFWASHLTQDQRMLLSRLLSGLISIETAWQIREAQLNALLEVFEPPQMTRDDIAPVLNMPRESFTTGEQEYIDDLLEQL